MGDSISRYQYVDLVHYFHTGFYVRDEDEPGILWQGNFGGYNPMYNYTNHYFSGKQSCDCFRNGRQVDRFLFDNRYWRDDCRNNTLTFIGKFGENSMKGHFNASNVYQKPPSSLNVSTLPAPPLWEFNASWANPIVEHINMLDPKPDYIYFNAGLWSPSGINQVLLDEAINVIQEADITPIFRTTTASHQDRPFPNEFDLDVCGHAIGNFTVEVSEDRPYLCHNMTWTQSLLQGTSANAPYYDKQHFKPRYNEIFNEQLLELIAEYEVNKIVVSSGR